MLDSKIIDYLKSKNAWFKDTDVDCSDYIQILQKMDIKLDSDFGIFFSYAEENSGGFSSRDFELWQICWIYENGDYENINNALITSLGLNQDYYVLSDFEAESAYFYNKLKNTVELIGYSNDGIKTIRVWDSFNNFLLWYFEL